MQGKYLSEPFWIEYILGCGYLCCGPGSLGQTFHPATAFTLSWYVQKSACWLPICCQIYVSLTNDQQIAEGSSNSLQRRLLNIFRMKYQRDFLSRHCHLLSYISKKPYEDINVYSLSANRIMHSCDSQSLGKPV